MVKFFFREGKSVELIIILNFLQCISDIDPTKTNINEIKLFVNFY